MKKNTKLLLAILTLIVSLFTISSCSKKIEYIYENVGSAYTTSREYLPYQEYVLDTTGTTHRKVSNHKIAYNTYRINHEKKYIAYLSDNARLGVRYYYKDENNSIYGEEPTMLTPISSNNGVDEYIISEKNYLGAYIVVVANKKTNYSIKVKVLFDKLGEEATVIEGYTTTTASLEGNNNVYYVEKDINENVEPDSFDKYDLLNYNSLTNSLNKSHEFMNIFTDEEETAYVDVYESVINTTDNNYKINVRKADEYNLEDIIDSEGNVYIDGDFNEWVVVNLDNSQYNYAVDYYDIEDGGDYTGIPYVLSKRIEGRDNSYTNKKDYIIRWYNATHESLDTDSICIRKGEQYNIFKTPKTYLEVNGKSYSHNDTVPLKNGDIVGLYYMDGGRHYVRCEIHNISLGGAWSWNGTLGRADDGGITKIVMNEKLEVFSVVTPGATSPTDYPGYPIAAGFHFTYRIG